MDSVRITNDSIIKFHPAVMATLMENDITGLFGIPSPITIYDPRHVIYATLTDHPKQASINRILAQFTDSETRTRIQTVIAQLFACGYIVDARENGELDKISDPYVLQLDFITRSVQEHFSAFGLQTGLNIMSSLHVWILGDDEIATALNGMLKRVHVKSRKLSDLGSPELLSSRHNSLLVGCAAADSHPELRSMNEFAVTHKLTALYSCVSNSRVRVGPLVVPGQSACLHCFERRVMANAWYPDEREAESVQLEGNHSTGRIPIALGTAMMANFILKVTMDVRHLAPAGEVTYFDLLANSLDVGRIVRDPRCEVCGNQARDRAPESSSRAAVFMRPKG